MTTHHPKFCIHTALQLLGLTTAKLLPMALEVFQILHSCYCCIGAIVTASNTPVRVPE